MIYRYHFVWRFKLFYARNVYENYCARSRYPKETSQDTILVILLRPKVTRRYMKPLFYNLWLKHHRLIGNFFSFPFLIFQWLYSGWGNTKNVYSIKTLRLSHAQCWHIKRGLLDPLHINILLNHVRKEALFWEVPRFDYFSIKMIFLDFYHRQKL